MLENHAKNNKYTVNIIKNGVVRNNNNNNVEKKFETGYGTNKNSSEILNDKSFQRVLPQILATCAKNLLLLTYGMTLGITTIAIPALEKSNVFQNMTDTQRKLRRDVLSLTENEISWFSSINLICVPLGCVISGAITQPIGRKRSMMLLNIPFFLVWILYYNASSLVTLYVALVISGLAGGLHEAPVLTYVAEITEPHLRGMLSATAPTTVIVGAVSQLILGNFYHWRTVVLVNMFFPVIAFIAISLVPESPHWLITRGRFNDAEKSLRWLRGWVTADEVQRELTHLRNVIQTQNSSRITISETINNYRQRAFIIPYLIIFATFFFGHFGGMMSIQTNAVKLFKILDSPVNEYKSTLILGIVDFAGAVTCVTLIRWTGKRKLLISTTAGCSVCLYALAGYAFFRHDPALSSAVSIFSWTPILLLNAYAFLIHAGIRLIPWVLIGEIFPTDIRAGASGAGAFWFYVFAFSANKSFHWTMHTIKVYGLLCLYGTVIALGSIFFYVFLPETEGLTLHEIEKHFTTKGNILKVLVGQQNLNGNCKLNNVNNSKSNIDAESYL